MSSESRAGFFEPRKWTMEDFDAKPGIDIATIDIAKILAEHRPTEETHNGEYTGRIACMTCGFLWPCSTAQMLALAEALAKQLGRTHRRMFGLGALPCRSCAARWR